MSSKPSHNLPSIQDMGQFRDRIVRWFDKNGRDYPWRRTSDPFRLLIAEMMLRRTKADQVKEVYTNLFKQYSNVQSMAEAKEEELEQILYPLGLRWRNPAFRFVAQEIKEKYKCKVPDTREQLTTLSGVGDYVAGAVLSIGYGKAEWMVDNNIGRLFKRYFELRTSREVRRDKHVVQIAKMYISGGNSRKANLAILDFAALVCTPRKPVCKCCPLRKECKSNYTEIK